MDVAEPFGQLFGRLVVDEGPATLPSGQQALTLHQIQGFPHRSRTHAELPREVALVGNGGVRLPLPHCDARGECVAHLQIERAGGEPSRTDHPVAKHIEPLPFASYLTGDTLFTLYFVTTPVFDSTSWASG